MIRTTSGTPQSMPRDMYDYVLSHMPNRNFVVATVTLLTITFRFHNSVLPCSILIEISDMLQQQEAQYFVDINLGVHVQF